MKEKTIYPEGLIISFEGLDCCFKETNYKAYIDRLYEDHKDENPYIFYESFPRYGNSMCIPVSKFLHGNLDRQELNNMQLAKNIFYNIDRMDYWHEISDNKELGCSTLYQYRNKNKKACFIFDRYSTSNTIYNPLDGKYDADVVTKDELLFEEEYFKVPHPDIVVWLRATNFEFIKKNLAIKENKDENELDTEYLEKVYNRSEKLFNNNNIGLFNRCGTNIAPVNINNSDLSARNNEDIIDDIVVLINAIIRLRNA